MNGKGANGLGDRSNDSSLVVGKLELIKIFSEKFLSVDACEVKVVKGWGIIRCSRVVVGCQKEKF